MARYKFYLLTYLLNESFAYDELQSMIEYVCTIYLSNIFVYSSHVYIFTVFCLFIRSVSVGLLRVRFLK
jgi:hypothetical protein